jgi:ATP-dependent RNA helicase SUPV3L1/SUV3
MELRPKPVETVQEIPTAEPSAEPQEAARPPDPRDPVLQPPPVEGPPTREPDIEPPGEEAPVEQPPEEEPPVKESPAFEDQAPAAEDLVGTAAPATAEAAESAQPQMIEIWRHGPPRPKRGPRRPREHVGDGSGQAERARDGGDQRHDRGKRRGQVPKRRPQRERDGGDRPHWQQRPRHERAVDPDSPFAALEALKKELEKSDGE